VYSEFENILARLNLVRIWRFPGGVKPAGRKTLSNQNSISTLPLAKRYYVSVKQHIGVEGNVQVAIGDTVQKGQKLSKSMNPLAVPVHAPTSGKVTSIGAHVSAHPSGLEELTIEIEPDGLEQWTELTPCSQYLEQPKIKIIEAICSAGISGMGGAGFPTHIKASPKKNVEFLIINGVECEPYITSDDRLMREHAWQIRQGVDVLNHLLSPKHVIFAIEDNKPEAIEAMKVACQENEKYLVCSIPTKYPAGGEKQLIQVLTNREVPNNGLPIDVGVIMHNVGTCFAVADAIFSGKPLIQRVVTLTGEALKTPKNVWAPIGTPIEHLLLQSHYQAERQSTKRVIMGGPMMGFAVISDQVPVVKMTNCILVPTEKEMPIAGEEQPCIRCGACADACPANLLPQQLFWHSKAKELDKAQEYNLFDCIECGACAFVCPSEIPLVHYYRIAKADINAQEIEKDKADKARERFEARKERLVREQQERDEKHRKAAEARKQSMTSDGGSAKDKIAAALARAKAKRQDGSEETTHAAPQPDKQDKVAAAIARAKAKREAAKQQDTEVKSVDPQENSGSEEVDPKKAKVAAAIARAKAKREAAKQEDTEVKSVDPQENSDSEEVDPKKAKVAAAIARAKAKREAAKQQDVKTKSADPKENTESESTSDQLNAAEAAEIERKAKNAARARARRIAIKEAKLASEAELKAKNDPDIKD
jgi:electron transport complex protein RnfC